MSDWGWHSFPNTEHLTHQETEAAFQLGHGHQEIYAVEYKNGGRSQAATLYFRQNPHRLSLGTIGLQFCDRDNRALPLSALSHIRQELRLWDGLIESAYSVDGQPVHVLTACHPEHDRMLYRIQTPLLSSRQARVSIRFSYPTGRHADDANDWRRPEAHQSRLIDQGSHHAIIERQLDSTVYYLSLRWEGEAQLTEQGAHHFLLTASGPGLAFSAEYLPALPELQTEPPVAQQMEATSHWWHRHWQQSAFADFGLCTDPRAPELERRVVLSQYLTYVNCANNMPPQETGLTYNSWFGRPHLEMTWWHAVDFALWNQPDVVAQMLRWYDDVAAPVARQIAERQGFKGLRWMKMTDPWAGEAPSNTGSFLIWQQPHYIYLAEEMYRAFPTDETLRRHADHVEQTAAFMADFCRDGILRGATAMQESMSRSFSYNHPFELAYWRYGLSVAQQWRERCGLPRHQDWDLLLQQLAPLPEQDSIYIAGKPLKPFEEFALKGRSDHPACLAPFALLPVQTVQADSATAVRTLRWVMNHWNWQTTWGWDYGMIAMAAARMGQPDVALQALLIDTQKNTYLPNGHNYQTRDRLRIYLPGNGALLTAVAMMCAGWDNAPSSPNPGFPRNGQWNVRWEGFHRMQ